MFRVRIALVSLLIVTSAVVTTANGPWQTALAKVSSKGKNTVDACKENFETAMRKYKEKDLDGAIDAFLQSIYFSRNYYNPQAYYWLGLCYMQKKQDGKAIDALNKHCEQAIGFTPEAHIYLAELYLRNDRLNEAEAEANLALTQYQGRGPKARNMLGKIKEKQGDLVQAQAEFLEALGDPPWRYTEAWMNYAENIMKQKQWGAAVNQFTLMLNNKIVLKGLDYETLFLDIGLCLLAKGDHQGAIDNWHECLNYNPQNTKAHLQLAMLLDAEQHFSSAMKEYREFVRLTNDTEAAEKIKERIHIIEQKLGPDESELPPPKPSMYTRQQQEQKEKEELKQKENLTPTTGPKESGF